MSKLGFWVAVSVVSLGAAVGAWYYKYQLYGWLPSTASSELKNVDGLLMDKEGKPFTGRVKDISDSGYSLYAYKDGKLDGLNVVFSEGQLREIGHWENGEQNGLFEAWTDKGVLVDHGIFKEALQKPLFPSRIEQNRSVRFFFTTSKNGVFLPSK